MLGNCSICLCAHTDPVSIPCGHVYCAKCLAGHVNSPGSVDAFTARCPTCRSTFYTVTPDLTYLPNKYHRYVIPAVRRVYIDSSAISALQRKLAKAESRVKKLESDQEILLKQCEAHIAASEARASSEHGALKEIEHLKRKVAKLSTYMDITDAQQCELERSVDQVKDQVAYWKSMYSKMRERLQSIDAHDDTDTHTKRKGKKSVKPRCDGTSRDANTSDSIMLETPTRQIKPIPRRVTRTTTQPIVTTERPKRQRMSCPNTTI